MGARTNVKSRSASPSFGTAAAKKKAKDHGCPAFQVTVPLIMVRHS